MCVLLSIPAKRCMAAVILRRLYVLTGLQERYETFLLIKKSFRKSYEDKTSL